MTGEVRVPVEWRRIAKESGAGDSERDQVKAFIYFARTEVWLKVGWSEQPRRRMHELRDPDGNGPPELIGAVCGNRQEETCLLAYLQDTREHGEWTRISAPLVVAVLDLLKHEGVNVDPDQATQERFWDDAPVRRAALERDAAVLAAIHSERQADGWTKPASMADLARIAGVARSTLYQALDDLVAHHAVERQRTSGRTPAHLKLTDIGLALLDASGRWPDAAGRLSDARSGGGGRGGSGSSLLSRQEIETKPSPEPGSQADQPSDAAGRCRTLAHVTTDELLRELGRRMLGTERVLPEGESAKEDGSGRWDPAEHRWLTGPLVAFWSAHGGQRPGAHPWQGACTASLEAAARALAHAMLLRARNDLKKDGMAAFWSSLAALRKDLRWGGLEAGARRQEFPDPRTAVEHAAGELAKWQAVQDKERAEAEAHRRDLEERRDRVRAREAEAPTVPPSSESDEDVRERLRKAAKGGATVEQAVRQLVGGRLK